MVEDVCHCCVAIGVGEKEKNSHDCSTLFIHWLCSIVVDRVALWGRVCVVSPMAPVDYNGSSLLVLYCAIYIFASSHHCLVLSWQASVLLPAGSAACMRINWLRLRRGRFTEDTQQGFLRGCGIYSCVPSQKMPTAFIVHSIACTILALLEDDY